MEHVVIYGALGGFIVNILQLLELKNKAPIDRPDFKDWLFWMPFVFWPLAGGMLVQIYIETKITMVPLVALNVGLSAPLTLRAMSEVTPIKPSGKIG